MLDKGFLLNNFNKNLEYFTLLGNRISYSLSDKIHNFIYKSLGLDEKYLYKIIDTNKEDDLESVIKYCSVKGGNLTTPYKKYLSSLESSSLFKGCFFYPCFEDKDKINWDKSFYSYTIGSSNTFFKKDDSICFCSTDVEGLKRSLLDDELNLDEIDNIMILGSGGVVEAIVEYFILRDKFIKKMDRRKNIYIFSRNKNASKSIGGIYSDSRNKGSSQDNGSVELNLSIRYYPLESGSLDEFIKDYNRVSKGNNSYKILCINALLSNVDISFLYSGFKKLNSLLNEMYFMDLNYSNRSDVLSNNRSFFKDEGIKFKDGLDMLIYQAMYSECIWLKKDWNEIFKLKSKIIDVLDNYR